jgi:hypothetical protein
MVVRCQGSHIFYTSCLQLEVHVPPETRVKSDGVCKVDRLCGLVISVV